MPAIEIKRLTKTYKVGFWKSTEKTALRGLDLEVHKGEVFGCLGPNGAGKTTTLKILMGLVYATSGTARILGKEIGDAALARQIGFLPEQPYFYDYLTATELLEYFAQLSGLGVGDRRRRAEQMLERVGLAPSARVQLRKFSKGMLQRLGIAQAIIHDPKLVFLDEPMSGLDPVGRREVRDLIQQLKDEGKTIFFSTHILSDAETLCDRVAVLHQGELRAVAVVSDLVAKARGRVEISWQGAGAQVAMARFSSRVHAAGELFRGEVADSDVFAALEVIRSSGARLVSVNPVHAGMEEFFLSQIGVLQNGAEKSTAPGDALTGEVTK